MVKYKLYGNIGDKGSFGEVLRARKVVNNIEYEQEVALKVLKKNEGEAKARFTREVNLLKSLNHPRVIKVIDCNLNSDKPFYVMPIYRTSLRACIKDIMGDWIKIKYVFNAMLDGIEYLHSKGICHRDIKPENFLLNSYKDLVVSDLGLGMCMGTESERMTMVGVTMGTICYMSPEQMKDSKSIDSRADIYSLGKVLYECITGNVPTTVDLNLVPSGMRFLISKCLAMYVHERFQNISELRDVFNSSIDVLIFGVKKDKIRNIIKQLVLKENNSKDIQILFGYLCKVDYKREQELVHDVVMKLPVDIIKVFEKKYEENYVELIKVFVENIITNGWQFEYTDTIASKCRDLFYNTNHLKVKGQMVYCLIKVAYYYDRPYVNKCVKQMLYSINDPDLAYIVRWYMEKLDKRIILKLGLDKNELHHIIKNYIFVRNKATNKKLNNNIDRSR